MSRSWPENLRRAFDQCEQIAKAHYENFPVASLLLPRESRPYVSSIYAFARIADDFADEGDRPAEERLRLLNDWEAKLTACYAGKSDHPVFLALSETIARYQIPRDLLSRLLQAFRLMSRSAAMQISRAPGVL